MQPQFAAKWTDLEMITVSEVKDKYITYTWDLKYDTNELVYKTETASQRTDSWPPRKQGEGRGLDWESGASRCRLLHIGWINSKS